MIVKGEPSYSEVLTCQHCGSRGPMRILETVSDTHMELLDERTGDTAECGMIYDVLKCSGCEMPTLRGGKYHEFMEPGDWCPEVMYPEPKKLPAALPDAVKKEYAAAQAVAAISANAHAVLLGRVLDAVCKDRDAKGGTLQERLNDLATRGEVPSTVAEMAQNVRQFRNVGAHADLGSLTTEEVPFLESLLVAVLEYIYEAPRLVETAKQRLAVIKGK